MSLGGKSENRKRFQHTSVETAPGGGRRYISVGANVEDRPASAWITAAVTRMKAVTGTEKVPTSVEMESEHDNHHEEQKDDRAEHDFAAQSIAAVSFCRDTGRNSEPAIIPTHGKVILNFQQ